MTDKDKTGKYAIKIELNNSTTAYNKSIVVSLQSDSEDVQTLLNYANDIVKKNQSSKLQEKEGST